MHPRVVLGLAATGSLVLLVLLFFVLVFDPNRAEPEGAVTNGFAGSIRPPSPPLDFTLRDEEGRTVRLSDFRGRPVVLTFMYTTCENDCPTMAQQIRGALDDRDEDVPALAVSVDPRRDTPRRARRFLTEQRLTGRMRFLLGDEAALQRVWRFYGIRPQEDGLEHSASVILVDPEGVARVSFPNDQLTPEGLGHALDALAGEGREAGGASA